MFRELVENSPDLVVVLEEDSTVRYVNPSVSDILGYTREEFVGTKFSRYLQDPEQVSRTIPGEAGGYSPESESFEVEVKHADGSLRRLEARIGALDDGEVAGRVCYARDVTARAASEKDLFYRAFHDHLTGLPNEALFMERLEHVLSRFPRYQERVAVLFMDLDNFKALNDRYGHRVGDQVLVAVGQRLKSCLRSMDTAARLHGDEFAVLVENVPNLDEVFRVCERLLASLSTPISVGDDTVQVAASIGIVLSGFQNNRSEALLHAADTAMYRAKAENESCYALHQGDIVPGASGDQDQSRRAPGGDVGSTQGGGPQRGGLQGGGPQRGPQRFANQKHGVEGEEYMPGRFGGVKLSTVSSPKKLL